MIKTITIEQAARRMGVSQQFLRLALQQDKFSFGTAVKMKNWRYYINNDQFEKYLERREASAQEKA